MRGHAEIIFTFWPPRLSAGRRRRLRSAGSGARRTRPDARHGVIVSRCGSAACAGRTRRPPPCALRHGTRSCPHSGSTTAADDHRRRSTGLRGGHRRRRRCVHSAAGRADRRAIRYKRTRVQCTHIYCTHSPHNKILYSRPHTIYSYALRIARHVVKRTYVWYIYLLFFANWKSPTFTIKFK